MKAKNQKATAEKEMPLLGQKGYKRMPNEPLLPIQQGEAYRKPTKKSVREAVQELNPDINSMDVRG